LNLSKERCKEVLNRNSLRISLRSAFHPVRKAFQDISNNLFCRISIEGVSAMRLFNPNGNGSNIPSIKFVDFRAMRIRTKLFLALIPSTILILIATGYATNWFLSQFLNEAIQRNVRLQTLALGHEIEIFLNQCREDLLELRQGPLTQSALSEFWRAQKQIRGWGYASVAYLTEDPNKCIYLVSREGELSAIRASDISLISPDPTKLLGSPESRNGEAVEVSPLIESLYPFLSSENQIQMVAKRVVRFGTGVPRRNSEGSDIVLLEVSVFQIRDILSRFNSPASPLHAFIRSPELRYSFLFDLDGWTWFQSEDPTTDKERDLSTQLARTGFSGIFGKPGLPCAFKPSSEHADYWRMIGDVKEGKSGLITVSDRGEKQASLIDEFYIAYAPVRFLPGFDQEPVTLGGIAFVDRSRLGIWAGYRHIDVMFVIALVSTILISLLIYGLGRVITRPLYDLAAAVNLLQETGKLDDISLPDHDRETTLLRHSINGLLSTIRSQMQEICIKDDRLVESSLREQARLEEEVRILKEKFCLPDIAEIVGLSPVVATLKREILKAASVDADVLIVGETGTGKQLAAEAIHRISSRAAGPFVSINCGALDEGLLMDELFGHIKGAFTEAKTDRKGAFMTAQGGTLFLDEIATASPRIQQSLLRAIAMRKVSPLGSDMETGVDVRVIAASNEDLRELVDQGRFRDDLYYRLNVVTIHTPSLREHMEDLPLLADHFLKEAGQQMNKEQIGLTRGALEKLKSYHWPGNVRELKNSITRAVAMTEKLLLHTDDIILQVADARTSTQAANEAAAPPSSEVTNLEALLFAERLQINDRQKKAIEHLLKHKEIRRSEYQLLFTDGLTTRTAIHDLQDLTKKGVLEISGRGPATRYNLSRRMQERTKSGED
jgi:DNA-binding NtrC family response regulator